MAEPQKFRKRPLVIEAIRWLGPPQGSALSTHLPPPGAVLNGPSVADLEAWGCLLEPATGWSEDFTLLVWVAPEGSWVRCPVGFWIIKGVAGEFYPCDPEIFATTYEPVDSA